MFLSFLLLGSEVLAINLKGSSEMEPEKKGFVTLKLKKTSRTVTEHNELINFLTKTQNYFLSEKQSNSILEDDTYYLDERIARKPLPMMIATAQNIGNVKLYNFKNSQYTGQIGVGSQDKTFDVIFDTGKD